MTTPSPGRGWRWLRVREIFKRGDQYDSPSFGKWTPVPFDKGDRVTCSNWARRRVKKGETMKAWAIKLIDDNEVHAILSASRGFVKQQRRFYLVKTKLIRVRITEIKPRKRKGKI